MRCEYGLEHFRGRVGGCPEEQRAVDKLQACCCWNLLEGAWDVVRSEKGWLICVRLDTHERTMASV